METPQRVQRKSRTGRVRESGTAGKDSMRKSIPLAAQMQAATTTRVMEARRRCSQVVAVRKKAVSTSAERERMERRKETKRVRSRSKGNSSEEYNASLGVAELLR